MRLEAIEVGKNAPEDINVVIEVPYGGHPIKYEMDKDSEAIFVDRILSTSMRYPGNYGFVPHTLSDDGDPIDVLVCQHSLANRLHISLSVIKTLRKTNGQRLTATVMQPKLKKQLLQQSLRTTLRSNVICTVVVGFVPRIYSRCCF